MAGHEELLPVAGQGKPRLTMGDIFRAHGEAYQQQHALSLEQGKVLHDIVACRTAVLGGHVDVCLKCGYEHIVFRSCRNRHCPNCQALTQARWIMARMARLLPVDYFHVVFTVPDDQIAGLALRNRELFFNAMYASGSQTLLTLGNDKKRLGAQLGLTAILHTWTRDLRFHPHLHCIVTGGGLTRDGLLWKTTRRDYLFPVRVLSDLFRDKLVAALDEAYRDGRLKLDGVPGFGNDTQRDVVWKRLKRKLYNTKWVSYAKPPFAGPEAVYKYLGRYTHRVGISNQRLISLTEDAVTFRTRGDDTATLHPQEFIRRFLLHVLPKGFVKLRHYGLLAPGNVNTKLATARRLLETIAAKESPPAPVPASKTDAVTDKPADWRALLLKLTGIDVTRCPVCGGILHPRPLEREPPRVKKDDTS